MLNMTPLRFCLSLWSLALVLVDLLPVWMALPMAIFINVLGPQNIDYSQWHSRVTEWQFSPSWSVLSIVYFVARMSASLEKTCHFKIPTRTRQNEHLFSRHYCEHCFSFREFVVLVSLDFFLLVHQGKAPIKCDCECLDRIESPVGICGLAYAWDFPWDSFPPAWFQCSRLVLICCWLIN